MNKNESKFRHELKFIISNSQRAILENSFKGLMQKDQHMAGDSYNIRSVYFDDYAHSCYYDNENGVDPREKFRIRIYNSDLSFIRLELKRKVNGMTQKLQCVLSDEQLNKIMNGQPLDNFDALPPLLKKFELQRLTRMLHPDIIVDYDRIPYVCSLGNVRVTFDMNIASCDNIKEFLSKNITRRPVLMTDMLILEVKYDDILPGYIENILKTVTAHKTSFSKFYLCKRYSAFGGVSPL